MDVDNSIVEIGNGINMVYGSGGYLLGISDLVSRELDRRYTLMFDGAVPLEVFFLSIIRVDLFHRQNV